MQTLFSDKSYIEMAVDRVINAYNFSRMINKENKLHVAFSGGKDSVAVYGVCKIASEKLGVDLLDMCEFQYNVTTIDPPELVKFIRDNFSFVKFHHPKVTFAQSIVKHKIPPTRMVRYCCAELKEVSTQKGQYTVTGVRKAESIKRGKREAFEIIDKNRTKLSDTSLCENTEVQVLRYCMQNQAYVCNPIIDWTDKEVWNFIHKYNLPYCCLYDKGFDRIGCIGCPLTSKEKRLKEFERYPGFYKLYMSAFEKMLRERESLGKKTDFWSNAQDVMDWWLDPDSYKKKDLELELFKDM